MKQVGRTRRSLRTGRVRSARHFRAASRRARLLWRDHLQAARTGPQGASVRDRHRCRRHLVLEPLSRRPLRFGELYRVIVRHAPRSRFFSRSSSAALSTAASKRRRSVTMSSNSRSTAVRIPVVSMAKASGRESLAAVVLARTASRISDKRGEREWSRAVASASACFAS